LSKKLRVLSIIAASTLVAGFAVAPVAQAAGTKQKVCVALDTGGINDKSFNQTSYAGALAARSRGFASSVEYLPAKSPADYVPNLKSFVDKKCTLIIGVGFTLGDAITASAAANPGIKYAIVDVGSGAANVKGITFKTNENSFLIGYLAAGMTKSGKVATYGGIQLPTVSIFMDGFARGVEYYNDVKSKNVQVLGWNTATKTGTFLGSFVDTNKALATSIAFEQQGADIIFPVAGGLQATTAANSLKSKKSNVIWVDSAVMGTGPQFRNVVPVSVLKGLNEGVLATIKEAFDGKFSNRQYVGTLKNKGVGFAITPAWRNKIPASLVKEVNDLGKDIAGGWVPVS
jgi:basic membrane protein A and related proteins